MERRKLPQTMLIAGLCFGICLAADTQESAAVYERVPGMRCFRHGEHSYTYLAQTYGSWLENNSWSKASYSCPIPSTEDLPLADVATVEVDVYDGNNDPDVYVQVKSCTYVAATGAVQCDGYGQTDETSTFANRKRLSLTFDPEFDDGDTFYLRVALPALDVSASKISSIYISD